jgi:hypothetical protein
MRSEGSAKREVRMTFASRTKPAGRAGGNNGGNNGGSPIALPIRGWYRKTPYIPREI